MIVFFLYKIISKKKNKKKKNIVLFYFYCLNFLSLQKKKKMQLLTKTLRVKKSQIPNCGNGLFTTKNINKDKFIAEYEGVIRRYEKVDSKNLFCFALSATHVIDGSDCICRFINDAKGPIQCPGLETNVEFLRVKNKIFVKASRYIAKGEELFVEYGNIYWQTVISNSNKN
jgi:SET domain-containing protein